MRCQAHYPFRRLGDDQCNYAINTVKGSAMNKLLKSAILVTGLLGSSAVFAVDGSALQQELQKMIDQTSMDKTQVIATVEDGGTVMLSGEIETQSELDSLIAKIKDVEGVTQVNSDVTAHN